MTLQNPVFVIPPFFPEKIVVCVAEPPMRCA